MTAHVGKQKSPRHGFEFSEVPTVRGSMYGGSVVVHHADSYGAILDSVFEMASDIADANGVTHESAICQVLKDEGWRLTPKHKAMILEKLKG